MNTSSGANTFAAEHTYIDGYCEDRVSNGHTRKYHYPHSPLPDLPNTEFPELEPSFVTALKIKK